MQSFHFTSEYQILLYYGQTSTLLHLPKNQKPVWEPAVWVNLVYSSLLLSTHWALFVPFEATLKATGVCEKAVQLMCV